jgi:hypothetical protein
MGFSKELIRVIGWWDERFYGGGFEDDDFVLRLRLNNLAYYESLEGTYEMHWKSPLQPEDGRSCIKSEPFFNKKWESSTNQLKKVLSEEIYTKYDGKIGDKREDISSNWKQWEESKIGVFFPERKITNFAGPSRTFHFRDELGNEFKKVTSI